MKKNLSSKQGFELCVFYKEKETVYCSRVSLKCECFFIQLNWFSWFAGIVIILRIEFSCD